jgi:hypothetical protein
MERVLMQNCGDGYRRADNGSFGKGPVVKTAAYTVKKADSGTIFSNRGASGAVTFTLPAALKGLWFTFLKPTQQNIVITATGGAKINGGTANKKYQNAAAEAGGQCTLVCDGTDWFVAGEKGTWANDNA